MKTVVVLQALFSVFPSHLGHTRLCSIGCYYSGELQQNSHVLISRFSHNELQKSVIYHSNIYINECYTHLRM